LGCEFLLGEVEPDYEEKLLCCVYELFYMEYELEHDAFVF